MQTPNIAPDIIIQGIRFSGDGMVEVTYSEGNDQSDHIAIIKVMMFDKKLMESQVNELLSDITDLIDAGIEKLRNPPMTRPSGLRPGA